MAQKVRPEGKKGLDVVRARAAGIVLVRFVRDESPFQKGQTKECLPAEAEKFVRQGAAEYAEDEE